MRIIKYLPMIVIFLNIIFLYQKRMFRTLEIDARKKLIQEAAEYTESIFYEDIQYYMELYNSAFLQNSEVELYTEGDFLKSSM